MPQDPSTLFDEIQRFRAEELPPRYVLLDGALPGVVRDSRPDLGEYASELQHYTDWAVEWTCKLVFPDSTQGRHPPDDFFLAFSIGSSLLNGEGRRICFSDRIVEPDLSNVFCPFCAAALRHDCFEGGGNDRDPGVLAQHTKDFLTRELPDAWFGLIANTLPRRVDFSVKAPHTDFAATGATRRGLFALLWKLKDLLASCVAEDLLLLDETKSFVSSKLVAEHLCGLLKVHAEVLGDCCHFDAVETYLPDAYDAFVGAAIFKLSKRENREKLWSQNYSLSRFLDIPMNWLLIGVDFSMTVCYGGSHRVDARRCNGMLFLYKKDPLTESERFALAEMAHLVLDNLVSLEDDFHASRQGMHDGSVRLKSALSYLSHDYTNSRNLLRAVESVDQAARIFETLLWLLNAARKYALEDEFKGESAYIGWTRGGLRGKESVGQTLQLAYDRCNDSNVSLKVECENLAGRRLDVRLVGVLTELARNIAKHTRKDGSGTITVRVLGDGDEVVIEAWAGPTYSDCCQRVRSVLALEDKYTLNHQWKGVLTIMRFCLDIVSDSLPAKAPDEWWQLDHSPDGSPMMRFESPLLRCESQTGSEKGEV